MDDGKSLLVAAGLAQGSATSVQAKAVWSRCQRVFKPFSESEAKLLAHGRNEYIHAAGVGFDAIPEHAWWPSFWSQAVILLHHIGKSIEDYVDARYLEVVNGALATRQETLRQQFEARIERARTMLSQAESETLSPRQLRERELWSFYATRYNSDVECPACADVATLYGDEVVNRDVTYETIDDWGEVDVQVTLWIEPRALFCDHCRLELNDYDLLVEAKLAEAFEVEGTADDIEYEVEYNNE
ncbi:hypothetical protein [Salana multivorans]|uniref:hypothetical protein n=1 Tax=Salana multivorans TaxID=120377 RepID=UPI00249209CA|nr:hypothetical protein [Salana multivorans]